MRDYVQRLLSQRWEVEAVADGWQALAVAGERVPDLVLADVMMPGLDGFALLRALRADPRTATMPVILLSARAGEESRVEGLEAGADDYLIKPFSARELLARVEAHLTLKRRRDEMQAAVRESEEALRLQCDPRPAGGGTHGRGRGPRPGAGAGECGPARGNRHAPAGRDPAAAAAGRPVPAREAGRHGDVAGQCGA